MDLRWLDAPEAEVAAAMAQLRSESRPRWLPTKRQVLVHVNFCLMLWYLGIAWFTLGVRIDAMQDDRIEPRDVRDMVVVTLIFVAWGGLAVVLKRWAARPPSPRARLAAWRQTLTALVNGFAPEPIRRATFTSLMNPERAGVYCHPRFVSHGVEFGTLVQRRHGKTAWRYLSVVLPAPLPHLVFEAVTPRSGAGSVPAGIPRSQRLSLEGDFDRTFVLHVPTGYERDALFVVTPDVMAALVDAAAGFHIEVIDDRVVFFTESRPDYTRPGPWLAVERVLTEAVPTLVASAARYRDERVPELNASPTVATVRAAFETPGTPWAEPARRIGAEGRRLRVRDRRTSRGWLVAAAIGWGLSLVLLYIVPGLFAFAAIMSIFDGH